MRLRSSLFACALLGASFGALGTTAGAAAAVTCVGDCGGDGKVTCAELMLGVNIALGAARVADCRAFDRSGDGNVTVDELSLAVNKALWGCVPVATATPTSTRTPTPVHPTPTATATPPSSFELELFDVGPNFFSIRKPKGWDIHIAGVCGTLGILIRDPHQPLRQVFYFGLIGPVYLKEAQRQIDLYYVNSGGFDIPWIDAPAVDPLSTENFFLHWPGIADMAAATAYMPQFPKLTDFTAVSRTAQPSAIPGGESALLRGLFTENGAVGEGQFLGTVWVSFPFTGVPSGGTAYGSILLGVTAPKHEFKYVEASLIASLESFRVTSGYIDWCVAQQQRLWGAVAEEGQTLRETSDLIFDAWQSRSQTSDITAEKSTDALRGVDRVYDPSTDQVYQVPAGWYADYDLHRGDYAMSGLQQLPDGSWPLWTAPVADGSAIH